MTDTSRAGARFAGVASESAAETARVMKASENMAGTRVETEDAKTATRESAICLLRANITFCTCGGLLPRGVLFKPSAEKSLQHAVPNWAGPRYALREVGSPIMTSCVPAKGGAVETKHMSGVQTRPKQRMNDFPRGDRSQHHVGVFWWRAC